MSDTTNATGEASTKTWFLTGASRGLGAVWAEAILARGDRLAATSRNAAHLDGLVERYNDQVLTLTLDVTNSAAAREAVRTAEQHFGHIDVLVNNAGHMLHGTLEEATDDQIRDQMETNFFGALWTTRAALPAMRERGSGHIIQVSSVGGLLAYPALGIYQASKWALEASSEALAAEVASHGLHVTLIEPVMFPTGLSSTSPQTTPDPAYASAHEALYATATASGFTPGDLSATAAALMKVVDSPSPPVRVLFGARGLEAVREAYAERLASLEQWQDVSLLAHGDTAATD